MVEPTEAEVTRAAWAWRNDKDRETDSSDDAYFRANWRSLPGLGAYVAAQVELRINDQFRHAIRFSRECRGLSLSEAARQAGIAKAHLHDLEAGRSRNPCVSTLIGLARAYGGSVADLAASAAVSWESAQFLRDVRIDLESSR